MEENDWTSDYLDKKAKGKLPKRKSAKTPEGVLVDHLDKLAKRFNVFARKVMWQGRNGAPDWLILINGTHYWVELKAPGKGATFPNNAHEENQLREHMRMQAAGVVVRVIDSEAELDRLFRHAGFVL